jgi:hypothetical protein
MRKLSERTASFILRSLRQNLSFPWCQRMLSRFELLPSVHHHAHYRVWNRRGHDMNIRSEKKVAQTRHSDWRVCGFSGGNMGRAADLQKTQVCATHYMHNNPVARGLVAQPGDWRWSRRGGAILLPGGQFRSGDG